MGGKDVPKIHICNAWDKGNKMKNTTQLKMGPTGLAQRCIMPFFTRPTTMCFPDVRDQHNLKKRAMEISHTVIRGGGKENDVY